MGVVSLELTDSVGRRIRGDDCRGQDLADSTWSDRLDQLLPLFPIRWHQAVETVDLSLECSVWALGQKKAG